MKLIIKADDLGYTDLYNTAAFEAFSRGIATAAGVMCDMPGSIDALRRLRKYPWISAGWQIRMWGTPVAAPSLVPTLCDERTGRFRRDVLSAGDVNPDQALYECKVQMSMFHKYLGKAPDTVHVTEDMQSPFCDAVRRVAKENGSVYCYDRTEDGKSGAGLLFPGEEHRGSIKILQFPEPGKGESFMTDSISGQLESYDPVEFYLDRRASFDEDAVVLQCWHPGIVDYYVEQLSDRTPEAKFFLLTRPADLHALCSDDAGDRIVKNRIELVSMRDALHGTREYQNHLRETGSRLYFR